jgi:NitT/TauT family transport system ATP-binding protein
MQQRVSLARVLVNRPRVLLMDEPFSALDAQTRLQMQEMLLDLWREFHMTVLFVTHDIDEAVYLGSRVAVLTRRPGCLKAIFDVNLPRPRETEVLVSPEFMRLKKSCMDLVRGETLGAPGSKFKAVQETDISPSAFPNKSASAAG